MPQAQLYHGTPRMVDFTPNAAVAAGDVVVVGRTPMIAHRDIPANTLGAVAAEGGVYTVAGDAAIVAGRKVYWKDSTDQVTETPTGNQTFGITVSACSGAAALCNVFHQPDGIVAA